MVLSYRLPSPDDPDTIVNKKVGRHELCENGNYKESDLTWKIYLIVIRRDHDPQTAEVKEVASYAGYGGEENGIAELMPPTTDREKEIIESYIENRWHPGLILPIEAPSRNTAVVKEDQVHKGRINYTDSEETKNEEELQARIYGSLHPLIIYFLSTYGEASPEIIAQRINSSPAVVRTGIIYVSKRVMELAMEHLSEISILEKVDRRYRIKREHPDVQRKLEDQELITLVKELFSKRT